MEQPMEEPPHQANIATALNNLVNLVTTNSQLIATLTASRKTLTKTNNNINNQLKQALNNNKAMAAEVKNMSTAAIENSTTHDNKHSNKRPHTWDGQGRIMPQFDPNEYCWTHGFKSRVGHNSCTCISQHKNKDHKKYATQNNTVGGSEKNKDCNFSKNDVTLQGGVNSVNAINLF